MRIVILEPEVGLFYTTLHQGMLVMCSVKEEINFDKTPDSENELFVVCARNGIKLLIFSSVCFHFLVCFGVHRFPIQHNKCTYLTRL